MTFNLIQRTEDFYWNNEVSAEEGSNAVFLSGLYVPFYSPIMNCVMLDDR